MSIEICFAFMYDFDRPYMKRKVVQWPSQTVIYYYLMYMFGFDAGNWTSLILTVSYGLGCSLTFFVSPKFEWKWKSVISYTFGAMTTAFIVHLLAVSYIYIIFIGGDYVVEEDVEWLTVLVTGGFFPGFTIGCRVVMTNFANSFYAQKEEDGEIESAEVSLATILKVMSIILIVPTVVALYINNDPEIAFTSASLSLVMEVGIKLVLVVKIYYALELEKIRDGDTAEFRGRKDAYFRRLAIKWHADILGEKTCILVGGVEALLILSGGDGLSKMNLSIITAVLYSTEFFADTIVVWLMDEYFDIPLLSAIPLETDLKKFFKESATLAFAVNAMAACTWMAVNANKMY